jgi:hypothetical protein
VKTPRTSLEPRHWILLAALVFVGHASVPLVSPTITKVTPVCTSEDKVDWRPDASPLFSSEVDAEAKPYSRVFTVTDRYFSPLGLVDLHVHREIHYQGDELLDCP